MIRVLFFKLVILLCLTPCLAQEDSASQRLGLTDRQHLIVTEQAIVDAQTFSPEHAVVMDPKFLFQITTCAMGSHTDYAWTQDMGAYWRFTVAWPHHRHVWNCYQFMQVDPKVYPVAVMTYRASNTVQNTFWDYHIDLFSRTNNYRPPYRGIRLDVPKVGLPLVADGQLREYRVDTRTCEFKVGDGITPRDPFYAIWVGTRSTQNVPATYDLVGIRFESTEQTRPDKPYGKDVPMTVLIVDQTDQPIAGAHVIVDAQRLNFAQSSQTDANGLTTITPLKNEVDQHMIRVKKEGFVTTDFFQVQSSANQTIKLHLSRATVFRGTVVDARGVGIPNVAVRMYPANRFKTPGGGAVLNRIAVRTDADGRWQSPPLPVEINDMCLRLTHPDYVSDRHAMIKPGHSAKEMTLGYPQAVMQDGTCFKSQLQPAEGLTLEKASIQMRCEKHSRPLKAVLSDTGDFRFFTIAPQSGEILIKAKGHVPMLIPFDATTQSLPERIQLKKTGRSLSGKLVYPEDNAIVFDRLEITMGDKEPWHIADCSIDKDGHWQFTDPLPHGALTINGCRGSQRVKLMTINPNIQHINLQVPEDAMRQPTSRNRRGPLIP